MQLSAPAMVDADKAFQVPSIYESNYIDSLFQLIQQEKIDAVISLNDLELPILSINKEKLAKAGAKVIISDQEVIDIAFDKWRTVDFLNSIGLKSPATFTDLTEALESIQRGILQFPLVIKPRWGSASIGIHFPIDIEELQLAYQLQKKRLQSTILKEVSNVNIDHSILIQEKIEGQEYGMDVLNDFEGNYVGTFVREKLAMRSGETDKAISVVDTRFEKIGRQIGTNLKHVGNLDCDVLELNGELYILELNPRFGGGYPFSHEAGVNIAAMYIDWLEDKTEIDKHIDYKSGIMFSKCDKLIRVN